MKITTIRRQGETWTRIRIKKKEIYQYAKALSGIGIDASRPDRENRIYMYWDRPGNLIPVMIGWDTAAGTDMNGTIRCKKERG